jgi:hypothetical protein
MLKYSVLCNHQATKWYFLYNTQHPTHNQEFALIITHTTAVCAVTLIQSVYMTFLVESRHQSNDKVGAICPQTGAG